MLLPSTVANSVRRGFAAFVDLFTGTNGTGLSNVWKSLGSALWSINSNQAATTTGPSSYPVASIPTTTTDMTVSTVGGTGTGVALWVTEAGNWWAVTSDRTSTTYYYTYSCNCTTSYYPCDCQVGLAKSCDTCWYFYINCTPDGVECWSEGVSYACNCYWYQYTYCRSTCATSSCSTCGASSTSVLHYLRVLRRAAGSVSAVASAQVSGAVAAIKAVVTGTSLNATGYADSAMTSAVGTIGHTLSEPAKRAGIVVSPASTNQATAVDSFELGGV